MRNATTTKEVYEKLLIMPDLHSVPELEGELLVWRLYKNAYIQACCDGNDACIEIISDSVYLGSLAHWHPDKGDMLEELYTLGKMGNILVIKKSILATEILYRGAPDQYPLSDKKEWHWGKKKWAGGRLIYLEQK